VGHDPDTLALVRRAGVVSAQNSPARIIPQRGQVSEYCSQPPNSERWAVLHEDVAASHLADDSPHVAPESGALTIEPVSVASDGDVLAREAARHDIHQTAPRSSVEGSHIVPDWEGGQVAVVLSGHEDGASVWLDFDGADGSPPEEFAPEYAASSACE
jgi:hypothetical protein